MLAYNRTWASVDALGVTAYVDCGGLGSSASAQRSALLTVDRVLDLCDAAVASIAYSWQSQVAAIKAVLPPALANATAPALAPLAPSLCNATSSASGNASVCGVNGTGLGLADLDLPVPPWLAGASPLDTAPPSLPLIVYEGGPGLVEQVRSMMGGGRLWCSWQRGNVSVFAATAAPLRPLHPFLARAPGRDRGRAARHPHGGPLRPFHRRQPRPPHGRHVPPLPRLLRQRGHRAHARE